MWIEATPNGKFKARERYVDPLTGKSKIATVTIDKDTRQARKAAENALREKIAGLTAVVSDSNTTIGEVAEAYKIHQERTVRPQTWKRDKNMVEKVTAMLGEKTLCSRLSARLIIMQLDATGKGNTTKNTYLKHLKMMLRWAYANDYVENISYLDKLKPYPDNKKERIEDKFLSSEELKLLVEGMKTVRWKLLTEFLALSGLRIGEAMALLDTDVTDEIAVNKTMDAYGKVTESAKTEAGNREVFVQPELAIVVKQIRHFAKLDKLQGGYRSDLFFPGIHYFSYNAYLKENSARLINHEITPHALRHTHVSLLAEQGVPLDAISRRVGHDDSEVTRKIYLHVTEKQKEKDREQIAKTVLIG